MGLDLALFEGSVPRDLLCAVCGRVLVQPEMSTCQHVFCSSCLRKSVTMACPVCGTWLQMTSYPPPSKLCVRLLGLRIRCDHKCVSSTTDSQLKEVQFGPSSQPPEQMPHPRGAGFPLQEAELRPPGVESHHPLRSLRLQGAGSLHLGEELRHQEEEKGFLKTIALLAATYQSSQEH
ncbi:TNF receptor-associated factor 4-like [Aplysia californica]|uniref:TNF receptor-associated factor 4-like n=1 Tax=Aplysia californica TaxID=6500 RepID=A0ABM1VQ81_APLCA|nr:TNF receptor-associated factor 4-like [Aplysia californica]